MKAPWGGAPPPLVLCTGVLRQAFIDWLVFGVPGGSGAYFWSSGAHAFPNLGRPGAHNGARWNLGRHQGASALKFFPVSATFGVFLGPGRLPKINRNSIPSGKNGPRVTFSAIFVAILLCFAFLVDFGSIFAGPDP